MITITREYGLRSFTIQCYKHQIIESNVLNDDDFCYTYLAFGKF
jgi:hypothetical protein